MKKIYYPKKSLVERKQFTGCFGNGFGILSEKGEKKFVHLYAAVRSHPFSAYKSGVKYIFGKIFISLTSCKKSKKIEIASFPVFAPQMGKIFIFSIIGLHSFYRIVLP